MAATPEPSYISAAMGWLVRREPIHSIARRLADSLVARQPGDIEPDPPLSLAALIARLVGPDPDGPLRLVVGDSRGAHRGERDEWTHGKMVRASSTDGAAGSELLLGLLQTRTPAPSLDFKFLVDEWPETPGEIAGSDLLVIGTGEVNFVAAFLQSLLWPVVQARGLADSLVYCRPDGAGACVDVPRADPAGGPLHPGVILVVKNPWNLDKHLIWIAGLTGRATADGARLVLSNSPKFQSAASTSVGLIYNAGPARVGPASLVAKRRHVAGVGYDWLPC